MSLKDVFLKQNMTQYKNNQSENVLEWEMSE